MRAFRNERSQVKRHGPGVDTAMKSGSEAPVLFVQVTSAAASKGSLDMLNWPYQNRLIRQLKHRLFADVGDALKR